MEKQEIEQIMKMLKIMEAEWEADRKADRENVKEITEKMGANQATLAKMEADRITDKEQLLSEVKTNQVSMDANMG
jgi:hypothetical protein